MDLNREKLLNLSDEELVSLCSVDPYKSTGNGGQKKNKTSSAIRMTLKDSSISVTESGDRQQSVNKKRAIRKMRMAIAMELRDEAKKWEGQLDMNAKNSQYPAFLACLIDNLVEKNWQVSDVAKLFDISTGRFIKILAKDDNLWQYVNQQRQRNNLKPLKK